jgi:hypothetical protein
VPEVWSDIPAYRNIHMTQLQIIGKLEAQLSAGISTEAEALYLMVAVRKLLEHQQAKEKYKYLTFHCDWALHSKLEGPTAQEILKQFDAANVHLKKGVELHDLPEGLRIEIERISKMKSFEDQLDAFLTSNGLPPLDRTRSDGWIHFLHLYAKIVEDCPLVMTATNTSASVASVTLNIKMVKRPERDGGPDVFFVVRWTILDKYGLSGEVFTVKSFWGEATSNDYI